MGIISIKKHRIILIALAVVSGSLMFSAGDAFAAVPDKIVDLTSTVMSETQVDLAWSTPGDGGSPITGYRIQTKVNGGLITTLETSYGDATSVWYNDMSLLCDFSVQYRMAAINVEGQGPYSNSPEAVVTDACDGGGGDDLQPLWDAIAAVEALIAQLQADLASLQNQIDNIGSSGLDVGGDLTVDGNILAPGEMCIGTCT